MVNDAPEPGVMFADRPGDGVDRHRGDQAHDQRLEQQGEAAVRPYPGHAERLDPAAGAMHARHTGVQKRLVLEEVEMPPAHLLGIVCRAVRRATGDAEARQLDIHIDFAAGSRFASN